MLHRHIKVFKQFQSEIESDEEEGEEENEKECENGANKGNKVVTKRTDPKK